MIKDERKAMVVLVFRAICRRGESDEEGEVIRSDDVDGQTAEPTSSEGAAAAAAAAAAAIGNWSTVGGRVIVVVAAAAGQEEESLSRGKARDRGA